MGRGQDKSFDLVSELELVALVRLPARFEYHNAAVRSVPPGSRFRVFQCEENHARCQLSDCDLGEPYALGYAAGRHSTYIEIESLPGNSHSPDCGCQACVTVRSVLRRLLGPGGPRPGAAHGRHRGAACSCNKERRHLADCAGPGCGATCGCWRHVGEAV